MKFHELTAHQNNNHAGTVSTDGGFNYLRNSCLNEEAKTRQVLMTADLPCVIIGIRFFPPY